MANSRIDQIKSAVAPFRQQILNHPLYGEISSMEDLHIFMQHHIYAVWDFMSLLKSLQKELTCIDIPWFPKQNANTSYLINEIVIGEESDVDLEGNRKSHFEMYLDAMQQAGADVNTFSKFVDQLKTSGDLKFSLEAIHASQAVRDFVNFTFDVIRSGKVHNQAAIFTFGREDLIPGMFIALIDDFYSKMPENISKFKYYLDRHIEVDGDHHSHLALEMVNDLCGDNEELWTEVEAISIASLNHRTALWNEVMLQIVNNRETIDIKILS
jgi:hypothetical protein